MHLCRKINRSALTPAGPSFLLNPLSLQNEDNSTQTAYHEWTYRLPPLFTLNPAWVLVASVPLDLGQTHTRERATKYWGVVAEARVPLILALLIYEYGCRLGP